MIGSGPVRTAGATAATSAYDAAAPAFDRHRALPDGVPQAIRTAILAAVQVASPRLLDLGAGTGRIGEPFVAAGDDYVAVDLSLGMLREFAHRGRPGLPLPRLAQADGRRLPFPDATFDAVMLIQVFGGMPGWRNVIAEARRVLRPRGALVTGRSVAPTDGVDAQMKRRLAALLVDLGVEADTANARDDVHRALESQAQAGTSVAAWTWNAERTARAFLDRHAGGARFAVLPEPVKTEAMARLAAWAMATFGSLDRVFSEPHAFELTMFSFTAGENRHA
jgi:ubiquinone/menaquinone biosynthesis C-methylase UbiE